MGVGVITWPTGPEMVKFPAESESQWCLSPSVAVMVAVEQVGGTGARVREVGTGLFIIAVQFRIQPCPATEPSEMKLMVMQPLKFREGGRPLPEKGPASKVPVVSVPEKMRR